MADGQRLDPYRAYNFRVLVGSKVSAEIAFSKVTGLEAEVDQTEYREGTDTATLRKLPGLVKYPNIVLERGITDSPELVQWFQEIVKLTEEAALPRDDAFRTDMTIQLLNRNLEIVREWVATAAWPCKMSVGDFDAGSSDVVIEQMEICHEGLSLVSFA